MHGLFVVSLAVLLILLGLTQWLSGYFLGALLITFNLLVLARILPHLIFMQKGAVFSLLLNFHLRLFFTGIALVVGVYLLQLHTIGLVLGLGTIIVSFMLWGAIFLVPHKQIKEG